MSEKKDKKSLIADNALPMIIGFAIIMALLFFGGNGKFGGLFSKEGQLISSFGQEPVKVWTELPSEHQAEIIAGFDIELPENPAEDYPYPVYMALQKTMIEVLYYDTEERDNIGFVIRKGAGEEDITNDTGTYRKVEMIDIGDVTVTMKGDGEMVSIMSWSNNGYSYAVNAKAAPMTQEKAEEYVRIIK